MAGVLTPSAVPAGWVFDLDGVIWLDDTPIPGSAATVGALQASGHRTLFVTNMSRLTVEAQEDKLARHGIEARGLVITSAIAAARLVQPGERVLVVGGQGIRDAVTERGAEVVAFGGADAVVVGMDPSFDYAQLTAATRAIRSGARLIATNTDAVYPTPEGLMPGAGAVLAAVVTASGTQPVVAGKPSIPLAEAIRERLGPDGIVVGDQADTDGLLARALGYRFGLVLSGTTSAADLPTDPPPDWVGADLADLSRQVLSPSGVDA